MSEEKTVIGWPAGQVEEAVTRLIGVAEGHQDRIEHIESMRADDLKLAKSYANIVLWTLGVVFTVVIAAAQFQFKNALEEHQQDFHGYSEYLPEE